MQLDECVRLPAERTDIERAMQLSLRWAERSRRAFEGAPAANMLFGIVQGGDSSDLRRTSACRLTKIGFHGYAIGGLAVGEPQAIMLAMIEETAPWLPVERPRYLMGVGTPEDLLEAVARGIDMFDCVLPTRHGTDATTAWPSPASARSIFATPVTPTTRVHSTKRVHGRHREIIRAPICII